MDVRIAATEQEKADAYSVRRQVFVEEQNVPPELEIDDLEDIAIHFVGYENHIPVAASRLRLVEDYGKLERICVLKEHRGKSYGKDIISRMEAYIQDKGLQKSKLNAQTHAEGFYKSLGYKTISDTFMDAGIPHVTMIKSL
ncbi:GNAT family N-acetyltransferase [Radiobacillus deserti]|uniref:GNAT family N-acetyltransferase n=1 Tax=Radiobacillus deserti TaxID=2594883 RepID=A0A516KEH9_9BACI|nr:GNAT family N-acetyltransferase [Radiobacillus deserti]QDP39812.1 GNAT family N-acetyltransferase [Radiobacillus deserti]